jgi:5'-nucleotidase
MEAVIGGIQAIAFSVDGPEDGEPRNYTGSALAAGQIAALAIKNGLPPGILLNVNVPYLPVEKLRGFRITHQGLRIYRDSLVRREDPRGRPYYWIGGDNPTGVPEEGTDFGALAEGFISITPIHLDLTAHQLEETFRTWGWPASLAG